MYLNPLPEPLGFSMGDQGLPTECWHPMRTLMHTGSHHTQGPDAILLQQSQEMDSAPFSSEFVCQLPSGETPVSCRFDI